MSPTPDGGHGADTNWSALAVDQMWNMVKDHDEAPGWTHRMAWQQIGELLDVHHFRMNAYRQLLASAWPPETSPASAAFLAQVDTMLNSLAEMRDAASANGPALAQINLGLGEARTKLADVHRAWAATQSTLDAYQQQTSSSSTTPRPTPGPPPIPTGQQAALHAEAVSIMSDLGQQTLEAQAAMKQPPPYQPPGISEREVTLPLTRNCPSNGSAPVAASAANTDLGGDVAYPKTLSAHVPETDSGSMLASEPTRASDPTIGLSPVNTQPYNKELEAKPSAIIQNPVHPTLIEGAPARPLPSTRSADETIYKPAPMSTDSTFGNKSVDTASTRKPAAVTGPVIGSLGQPIDRESHRSPFYEQWAIDHGVRPVISPPEEQRHHPVGKIVGPKR